jgi:hypothetical protein
MAAANKIFAGAVDQLPGLRQMQLNIYKQITYNLKTKKNGNNQMGNRPNTFRDPV